MGSARIRLRRTQVGSELSQELDSVVGDDFVFTDRLLKELAPTNDLEFLGVQALVRHEPPFDRPYKCTWYKGRYYCKYYRRGAWFLIFDSNEVAALDCGALVDSVAMMSSITREEVERLSAEKNVSATRGFYRRDELD